MRHRRNILAVIVAACATLAMGCAKAEDGEVYQPGTREQPKGVSNLLTENDSVKYRYAITQGVGREEVVVRVVEVEIDLARWRPFWLALVTSQIHGGRVATGPGSDLAFDPSLPMEPGPGRSILIQKQYDGTVMMAMHGQGFLVFQNVDGSRTQYRGPDLYSIFHLLHGSDAAASDAELERGK